MFSTPLWLAAIGTLAIPLLLHLWSRRPRRVIRVGSLRHLRQLPESRERSTRLDNPLLLLLRILVLLLVVLGLAGPRYGGAPLGLPASITLIAPDLPPPLRDSLLSLDQSIRLLLPGLPETDQGMAPATMRDTLPLWTALAQADRMVRPGGQIEVYAAPRLARLGQRRPRLQSRVLWHRPGGVWEDHAWVGYAARRADDSLVAVVGTGGPARIEYRRLVLGDSGKLPGPTTIVDRVDHRLGVSIPARDTALNRRLWLAVEVVAEALGQSARLVPAGGETDTVLQLPVAVAAAAHLPDSLLARWPWPALDPDRGDPREVSIRQAVPQMGPATPADRPDHGRELLALALLLLLLERWISSRPEGAA
jgi:hypothetical protein